MTTVGNLAGGSQPVQQPIQSPVQPPKKPKGFFNKVLHGIGTGLKVAGEVVITIALSGEGAMNDE